MPNEPNVRRNLWEEFPFLVKLTNFNLCAASRWRAVEEIKVWISDNLFEKYVYCGDGFFRFKSEHDALLFKLRWS